MKTFSKKSKVESRKIFLSLSALALMSMSALAQTSEDTITILMKQLEDIEVSVKRVQQTTLSTAVMKNEDLNRDNTGQNLPYLLSTTPGLQVTSDDGLGVGYTYFRVRGTDHSRINMTVNEVQLNDQESQTVFWVNMSDMASSVSQIDVQRGVGTSTSGSAFGAGLNMQTNFLDTTSHITIGFNGGMYNTFREMVSAHASIANRWMINARFSKVNSDGFLYRAKSDLYSFYGDVGWYGNKTHVILRAFGGAEKTGMAWEGVDYNTAYGIDGADRRYNPAGEYTMPAADGSDSTVYYKNQTDNYAQQHGQLTINHRFTPQWSLTATLHYTHGGGYYEQYKKKKYSYWGLSDSGKTYGLYMKHLNNHYAGFIVSGKYHCGGTAAHVAPCRCGGGQLRDGGRRSFSRGPDVALHRCHSANPPGTEPAASRIRHRGVHRR